MALIKTGLPTCWVFTCWFTFMAFTQAGHHIVPLHELEVRDGGEAWKNALEWQLTPWNDGWKPGVRTTVDAWLARAADEAVEPQNLGMFTPQRDLRLAIHAPKGGVVEGFVDLLSRSGELQAFAFTLDTAKLADVGEDGIAEIRKSHYRRLAQGSLPGTAWFRHLAGNPAPTPGFANVPNDFDSTFAMFSGSRAVAENLALDREIILGDEAADAPQTAIAEIPGITVRAIDWTERLKAGDEPVVDPLAMAIPADQHALFAPSMSALLDFTDWIEKEGLPVMQALSSASPYQDLIGRYREQLGLDLPDMMARQLKLRGVAVTGGDPYFPSGTDVAVVFDAEDPQAFHRTLLTTMRIKAMAKRATTQEYQGEGWQAVSFVTPDRALSCHVMHVGRLVVVANSSVQVRKLAAVASGGAGALGALDEFRFFRQRYPMQADETAFLFISDETIRRWCGPESRIGASRRARATAALLDLTASSIDGKAPADTYAALLGKVSSSGGRIHSETHGSLGFMTPIAELGIATASEREKSGYETWRRGYESGWPMVFDPIAARFTVGAEHRAMDLTVLPLTAGSDYEDWIKLAGKAALSPRARAVPEGASCFLSLAVDRDAEMFRSFDQQLVEFLPELKIEPLGWMAGSVSLWLDDRELAEAVPGYFKNTDTLASLPAVLRVESKSSVKLALFLTAVRASIGQSSPGLLKWENRTHGDHTYVVVSQAEDAFMDITLYYATLRSALLVSLDEITLIRAIAREKSALPDALPAARHAFAEATPSTLGAFMNMSGRHDHFSREQITSWTALPVLNEWKRRHPDRVPAKLHLEKFATAIHCPGGRGYRWNAEDMTMESVTFGHPAAPRADDPPVSPMARYAAMRAGLDFEDGGLRVRASVGPIEARLPVELVNDGELLGRAVDYFLNDPGRTLVYGYDDYEEDDAGEWKKVRKSCTERLLKPEDGSPIRVLESLAGEEKWQQRYSIENGVRLMAQVSEDSSNEFAEGNLVLPVELRAGAIHEMTTRETGRHEEEDYKAFHRYVIRIIGHERVEVPAGVFEDALRVELLRHAIHHGGEPDDGYAYSASETLWYAKDIGLIKAEVVSEGDTDTTVLMEIKP